MIGIFFITWKIIMKTKGRWKYDWINYTLNTDNSEKIIKTKNVNLMPSTCMNLSSSVGQKKQQFHFSSRRYFIITISISWRPFASINCFLDLSLKKWFKLTKKLRQKILFQYLVYHFISENFNKTVFTITFIDKTLIFYKIINSMTIQLEIAV
jgi:hypothetical protein